MCVLNYIVVRQRLYLISISDSSASGFWKEYFKWLFPTLEKFLDDIIILRDIFADRKQLKESLSDLNLGFISQ